MNLDGIELRYAHGLWLGFVPSRFGLIEVLLSGSKESLDEAEVAAFRGFRDDLDNNVAKLRKQVPLGILYRPIRIAINREKKVGVQFLNRLTRNQSRLVQEPSPRQSG